MENILTTKGLNGFAKKDLGTAEILEAKAVNTYLFDRFTAFATVGEDGKRVMEAPTQEQMHRFVRLNYSYLRHFGFSERKAFSIAFCRWLAVRESLVSPRFDPVDFHVQYTEALEIIATPEEFTSSLIFRAKKEQETEEEYREARDTYRTQQLILRYGPDSDTRLKNNRWISQDLLTRYGVELDDETGEFSRVDLDFFITYFPDLICLIAFVFRSRGHHYIGTYEAIYRRLYASCGLNPDNMEFSFQELATVTFHAIYPIILDEFWLGCARDNLCAGSLVKRIGCAPAGSAYVYALRHGLDDIFMVFPVIKEENQDKYDRLVQFHERLIANRWLGSINHTFYGVGREILDESLFSALASIVIGVYKEFVPTSPLLGSVSLTRIGNNAPLIGAVIGTALKALTRSEAYNKKYIEVQTRPRVEEPASEEEEE